MSEDYIERLGLVMMPQQDEQDYGTAETMHANPRKKGGRRRASKAPGTDDDSKKNGKRGRPRVDQQDESAVERRRTQIRLAQRAYRERKETTIAELEKQVSQLQGTIADMSQTYFDFNDKAIAAGIVNWNPSLGQELHATTRRLLELSRGASMGTNHREDSPQRKKLGHKSAKAQGSEVSGVGADRGPRGTSPTTSDSSTDQPGPDDMLGYRIFESSPEQAGSEGFGSRAQPEQQTTWNETPMDMQQYRASVGEPQELAGQWKEWVDKPMKPIYTYNFQETSFARRLLRYAYEQTYHLLTNPASTQERIHDVLRYSLCIGDTKSIAQKIKLKLMKSKDESLEHWEVPVLHIGGSGLHFPRDRADNTVELIQGYARERNIGPWPMNRAARQVPIEDFPFELAKFANVEGVWFDTYDVEQYLRTKGLFLDGHSPTAIVEIEDDSSSHAPEIFLESPRSTSTDSFSLPQSPASINDPMATFFVPSTDETFDNLEPFQNQAFDAINLDFALPQEPLETKDVLALAPDSNFMLNGLPFVPLVQPKKRVAIDVDRLLEVLNQNAVCLGRAPGFRMEDVDAAFRTVLQESW